MAARTKKATKKATKKKATTKRKRKSRATGRPPGRPPFKPTEKDRLQVKLAVGYGFTYEQIATLIINPQTGKGISPTTLQEHFRAELDAGKVAADFSVANSLFKKATSPDHPQAATCAIWWTKARMGWRSEEKHTVDFEGKSGVLVVPATVTPAEWVEDQERKNAQKESPE